MKIGYEWCSVFTLQTEKEEKEWTKAKRIKKFVYCPSNEQQVLVRTNPFDGILMSGWNLLHKIHFTIWFFSSSVWNEMKWLSRASENKEEKKLLLLLYLLFICLWHPSTYFRHLFALLRFFFLVCLYLFCMESTMMSTANGMQGAIETKSA